MPKSKAQSGEPITWANEQRRLGDLKPWPRNPRQIKSEQAKRLEDSFASFGQVETIAVGPNNEVYNGHQRLNVLMAENGPEYVVDVRVSSRPLTEKEREKLTIYLHKGAAGEFNFDVLANEFEFAELVEWGFAERELIGATPPEPNEWDNVFGKLPDEDRAPFQQMTFTLHDTQVEQVKDALKIAGKLGDFTGTQNENSNGNAIAFICETFITEHGNG